MDKENKHGRMEQNIKENINKGKSKVKANLFGQIIQVIKGTS